jgi:hypothetical protein
MSRVWREHSERIAEEFNACDWPGDGAFTMTDDPDPHKPCTLWMPDGAGLEFCHHDTNGVDQARCKWIMDACNQRLERERGEEPQS